MSTDMEGIHAEGFSLLVTVGSGSITSARSATGLWGCSETTGKLA